MRYKFPSGEKKNKIRPRFLSDDATCSCRRRNRPASASPRKPEVQYCITLTSQSALRVTVHSAHFQLEQRRVAARDAHETRPQRTLTRELAELPLSVESAVTGGVPVGVPSTISFTFHFSRLCRIADADSLALCSRSRRCQRQTETACSFECQVISLHSTVARYPSRYRHLYYQSDRHLFVITAKNKGDDIRHNLARDCDRRSPRVRVIICTALGGFDAGDCAPLCSGAHYLVLHVHSMRGGNNRKQDTRMFCSCCFAVAPHSTRFSRYYRVKDLHTL